MSAKPLPFPKNNASDLFLPAVAAQPSQGIYQELIAKARNSGAEYSKIWDLFAFQEQFTIHMARFTQGALRTPASISPALRELIAASTSYQNQCAFCTQAHAAAAADLFADEALVWSALEDLENAPLGEPEKAMLRFTNRVTTNLASITHEDVEQVRQAGWDDEAIYYAITTTALFNFYNRWISATGVPEMSIEAHRMQGRNLARHGYVRGESK